MGNGPPDDCKTYWHHLSSFFLALFYCCLTQAAAVENLSINVYLKLKPGNSIAVLIKQFNDKAKAGHLFFDYHITPFLEYRPLHNTLYLTAYDRRQIPSVLKRVRALAKNQAPLRLTTEAFLGSETGYVMLSIANNKSLQRLSDLVLHALKELRDTSATIPPWATRDKKRQALFKAFGSPNVLSYYNPHFSIFEPMHLSLQEVASLNQQLQGIIDHFNRARCVHVSAVSYALGVGIADDQGQIVSELASFDLGLQPLGGRQ